MLIVNRLKCADGVVEVGGGMSIKQLIYSYFFFGVLFSSLCMCRVCGVVPFVYVVGFAFGLGGAYKCPCWFPFDYARLIGWQRNPLAVLNAAVTVAVAVAAAAPVSGVKCGTNAIQRIVGGVSAQPGQLPWIVSLEAPQGQQLCGAAIIAAQWLVTAGHCVARYQSLYPIPTGYTYALAFSFVSLYWCNHHRQ